MADLVTIDEAKQRLRILHNDDDADLLAIIAQASDTIVDYLKRPEIDPPWDETTVPPHVKNATLLLIGRIYADREAGFDGGLLNQAIRDLVHRDRDPALA
jgi:hypothetical protein